LAESTNKNLIKIIKRTVVENHKNWHNALLNALWANRVMPKVVLGNSPFFSYMEEKQFCHLTFFFLHFSCDRKSKKKIVPLWKTELML
jgi:hypothetical protein